MTRTTRERLDRLWDLCQSPDWPTARGKLIAARHAYDGIDKAMVDAITELIAENDKEFGYADPVGSDS